MFGEVRSRIGMDWGFSIGYDLRMTIYQENLQGTIEEDLVLFLK